MIRVLSYPPRHDYVDRLHDTAAHLVHRDEAWPRLPRFYDPGWVGAHAGGWDLAHLHFTWEQHRPATVAAVLDAHRDAGIPVVWTAHDLRNPHTPGRAVDDAYLHLLARRVDAVLTLTPGAAAEVAARFGREAQVVPHGPLLDARPDRARPTARSPARLLLHAKSLRANLDVAAAVRAAERAVAAGAELELVVAVHDDPAVRAVVAELAPGAGVRVEAHPRWSLPELVAAIADADALVLPYRWGTHSGMLELATDVGTPVVASDVGYLREQAPVRSVPVAGERVDVAALAEAFADLTAGRGIPPAVPWADREASRRTFVDDHRRLYAGLTT